MSEKGKTREASGPGWFATLGGAAILVVLGFGVGLVAGAAWEEPDLVMDHFAGRTTEVPLVETDGFADAEAEPEPAAVDAGEPRRPRPLGSPRTEEAQRAPSSRPAVTAARAAGGHAIQVGAFGDRKGAEALVAELRGRGFPVYVIEDTGGSARFKVRVGPVAERGQAEDLAERLKNEHRLPTWILSRDAR